MEGNDWASVGAISEHSSSEDLDRSNVLDIDDLSLLILYGSFVNVLR